VGSKRGCRCLPDLCLTTLRRRRLSLLDANLDTYIRLTAIPVLLNAFLVGPELRYCADLAKVEILFADEERLERLEYWIFENGQKPRVDDGTKQGSLLASHAGTIRATVLLPTFPAGAVSTSLKGRLHALSPAPISYSWMFTKFQTSSIKTTLPPADIKPDDGSQILFSSGTTVSEPDLSIHIPPTLTLSSKLGSPHSLHLYRAFPKPFCNPTAPGP